MEYIDVLDEKGNKTGEARSYADVHAEGLWHRVSHVWVVNSSKEILLQHRAKEKVNHPNLWDISAAGHVSAGEDASVAAVREMEEEIGIQALPKDLRLIATVVHKNALNSGTYLDNEFCNIYLLQKDCEISELQMQESEVQGLKWVSLAELKKLVEDVSPELVPHKEEYEILFKAIENL